MAAFAMRIRDSGCARLGAAKAKSSKGGMGKRATGAAQIKAKIDHFSRYALCIE